MWTNHGVWLGLEEGLSQAPAAGMGMGLVKVLGQQLGSDLPVLLKRGPFGLYVQLVSMCSAVCSSVVGLREWRQGGSGGAEAANLIDEEEGTRGSARPQQQAW